MRGRPSKSRIRNKIAAIINRVELSYGYEIYKFYKEVYGDNITSRIIYYHLKKGVEIGEFSVIRVKRALGFYSWGGESERIYYAIGPYASLIENDLINASKIKYELKEFEHDWEGEIQKYYNELKERVRQAKGRDTEKIINKCDKLLDWCKLRLKNPEEYINKIGFIKKYLKSTF